jgi:uncharacterized membrane protein
MKKISNKYKKFLNFPTTLVVFSVIGLLASAAISIEKVRLLKNPDVDLSCGLNPVYSCASVITSEQASIFGLSNEIMGIAFFGGTLALGLALISGAKLATWLHKLFWLGLLGSMFMVIWFFYQSVYNINALCLYCTVVWFSTWLIFVFYSRWLLTSKIITTHGQLKKVSDTFIKYAWSIWFIGVATFVILILNHFWYYYGQYF